MNIPLRPYLIRAFYDCIVDIQLTPYIIINAEEKDVVVPTEYIKEGKIVLNIAPAVVQGLVLGNEFIEFKARFSGVSRSIVAPICSVLAIYAKETGRGMPFTDEDMQSLSTTSPPEPGPTKPTKPKLRIVK